MAVDYNAALNVPLDVSKLIQHRLADNQYFPEENKKIQILLHHTASNSNPFRCIDYWNSEPSRVGAQFCIGGSPDSDPHKVEQWQDGDIVQAMASKHWIYHLGLQTEVFAKLGLPYKQLDKTSIGIEINNWGGLTLKDGKYYSYVGTVVDPSEVIEYAAPFRGKKYYQKYTDKQIESTIRLVKYLCEKFNIPKTYNEDMWDLSKRAMSGTPGIWSHISCRLDKSDLHPQPELIDGLKRLASS